MTGTHTITVAVAACGRPDDLGRCLEGIAAQTLAPTEVIVVDQDPSDAARNLATPKGKVSVRYVEQPRLGLSASRNLALELATSELLCVTDDDCRPDPGWLEAIAAAIQREPRPGAICGPILTLGAQPDGGHAISLRLDQQPVDNGLETMPWAVGSGGNFAALSALLRDVGGWDERLGAGSPGLAAEDSELIYRLLRAGEVVRNEPGAIVRHAWHSRDRRLETRWSYGYGIGAMCGLLLARRDPRALRMIGAYERLHVRPIVKSVVRRDRRMFEEHWRALISPWPGLGHGLLASRRPRRSAAEA